ncbi:hypothetical protein Gotri_013774, partial [Gossypium trilobum]|nr:hypothetical protein [Gossypium trilobum]
PVSGNGRCWQHSNYGRSSSYFTSRNLNYGGYDSSFTPRWLDHGGDDIILICGATTYNSAPCEGPVCGNGRCWQHLDYGEMEDIGSIDRSRLVGRSICGSKVTLSSA